ncbi:hypothetical protein AAVH_27902 [Aphelenchoides avenae]|nr:hypothetical protein AAVH_27902 [Aphelenchus avenae]
MHSRFLRDIVNRNSGALPYRSIYEITANGGSVKISLEKESYEECNTFEVSKLTRFSLRLLFDRVNRAFVERLAVDFTGKDDVRFLRYLRDQAAALECRIETLSITVADEPRTNIDYAMVDFVACRLRPQELDVGMYDAHLVTPSAMLFDHVSMRSTLKRVKFRGGII